MDQPAAQPEPAEVGRAEAVETRSSRRAAREELLRHPVMPPSGTIRRPLLAGASVVLALVVALAAYAAPVILAVAVGWLGLVVAWGWPRLLGSSSRFGSTLAIGLAGVLAPAAVAVTREGPPLRLVPVAVAIALVAMFLHQLLRRDGRPRLTESVSITAAGTAVVTMGSVYVPLARTMHGEQVLLCALVGVAAGSLADLLASSVRARAWMPALTMVLGGIGGALCALAPGPPSVRVGLMLGLFTSVVAFSVRRVLSVLPGMASWRGQLTAAAAAILVPAAVVRLIALFLVA